MDEHCKGRGPTRVVLERLQRGAGLERARERRNAQLLEARNNPEDLLQLLLPRRVLSFKKCLLLVVDDVDSIDGESVGLILRLFEAAEKSEGKYRVCIVLGYNPSNPDD